MLNIVVFKRYYASMGKAESLTWQEAVNMFATPKAISKMTAEDLNPKGKTQQEIKEVKNIIDAEKQAVGFVFWGETNGGRKRKVDIINHSAVALDYDDIQTSPAEFLRKLESALAGYNYMYYSTTKNTADSLRLRIIVPTARPTAGDEYQATARAIIAKIGTDGIDSSTIEDSRAMGFTVLLKGQTYIYKAVTDKETVDPDKLLAESYKDWHDTASWLLLPSENKVITEATRRTSKAANGGRAVSADEYVDAANRNGIEGAFCRTYTVAQGIEKYLNDIYKPTADASRYTYIHGSSTGGLVVFGENGGQAVYSHHSTDPAGGMIYNIFDLIRIHKYGREDDPDKDYTNKRKRPSYALMKKWAESIPEVQRKVKNIQRPTGTITAEEMALAQQFTDPANFPANDYGIARAMSIIYKDKYRWAEDAGVWLEYDGIRWVEIKETRLIGAFPKLATIYTELAATSTDSNTITHCADSIGYCQKNNYQKMALAQLKDMLRTKIEDMDADNWLINTTTGVIDLRALESGEDWLKPHSPNDKFLHVIGTGVTADTVDDPECEKFIMNTLPDDEVRRYVQMLAGYTLTGATSEKKLFILHGEKGNNGKTMFANLWQNTLGDYGGVAEDKLILTKKNDGGAEGASPFLASLKGLRLAVTEEIAAGRKLDSAVVKRITGSATISCRKLRQDPIKYKPTYKLIICANDAPTLQDCADTAMLIRTRIIPFDAFFSAKKGNLDPTIEEKVESESWKQTFLNWALIGYAMWREQGRLDDYTADMSIFESNLPARMKQAMATYIDNSDDIGDFIETYLDITGDPDDFIATSQLYDLYVTVHKMGYTLSDRIFKTQLAKAMQQREQEGVKQVRKRVTERAGLVSNARGYAGVKWLDVHSAERILEIVSTSRAGVA